MSTQILFLDDWYKDENRNVIVDETTSNNSFLHLAQLYKSMGIANHAFPLQLHDADLQGINPHDEDALNSRELQMRIALECSTNHFYYLREVARIPSSAGNLEIKFKAHRANIATAWLFFNHITTLLLQPRQTYKTHSTLQLMVNIMFNTTSNSKSNWLTKDETLRAKTFAEFKEIWNELPEYLQHIKQSGGLSNTEEAYVKALNNKLTGLIANASPKLAEKLGRGLTSPIDIVDELSFIANSEITIPAMLSNMTTAADVARESGAPYGAILATTAGKLDDRDGSFAFSLFDRAAPWTEHFFDCKNEASLIDTVMKSCKTIKGKMKTPLVNCSFSHRQLGFTDEWVRNKMAATLGSKEQAERDYLNHWTFGNSLGVLTLDQINRLKKFEITDSYVEIDDMFNYSITWFVPKDKIASVMNRDHHILTADTSDLSGGDDTYIHFINVRTGASDATAMISESSINTLANWIYHLLIKYPNMTGLFERKSSAIAIYDILFELLVSVNIDPFKRLFNKVIQEKGEDLKRYEEVMNERRRSIDMCLKYKKCFGFTTSFGGTNARSILYGRVFRNTIESFSDRVHDPVTIKQLCALEERNGKISHTSSGHDDAVISLLLGHWLLTHGRNFHDYGLDPSVILSANNSYNDITLVSNQKEKEQLELRQVINDVYEELKLTKDDTIALKLERRLILLASYLDNKLINSMSVDQMLMNVKENKKYGRMERMVNRSANGRTDRIDQSSRRSDLFGVHSR